MNLDAMRCQDVVVRFTCHFDLGEHEAMLALFAPQGLWHRREGEVRGRKGLSSFLQERGQRWLTRHLLTNLRTTFPADAAAVVDSYVTAYRAERRAGDAVHDLGRPLLIGRYRDELVLTEGTWLISSRRLIEDLR